MTAHAEEFFTLDEVNRLKIIHLRWLRLQHCGSEDVHVVKEATGVYHERLATELHDAGFWVSLAPPHRWGLAALEIRYLGTLLRWRDVLMDDALREENRLEKYLSTDTPADIIGSACV